MNLEEDKVLLKLLLNLGLSIIGVDVCNYLGHVCLCGAAGYKISEIAINMFKKPEETLEKGDFILISSRDHTISDVISFVLGCSRRNDPEKISILLIQRLKLQRGNIIILLAILRMRKQFILFIVSIYLLEMN